MASPLISRSRRTILQKQVLQSATPVLVDFWAEWCGPCKMIAPLLDELADEYDGKVKIGKVNIDEQQALADPIRHPRHPDAFADQQRPGRRTNGRRKKQARPQGQPRPRRGLSGAGVCPFIVTPRQFTQRAEFYHQLAQLTSAGIGVVPRWNKSNAIRPPVHFANRSSTFSTNSPKAAPLAESLRNVRWLPEFDIALIEAGERSGRLDACFRLLADYYNDRARIAKQVISQLIYPVGLVHFAAFVFLIVLPFAALAIQRQPDLCFSSKPRSFLRRFISSRFYDLRHAKQTRRKMARANRILCQSDSNSGTARRYLALARLAAALEALISAGVNIIEAWDLAATASGSPALRRAVATGNRKLPPARTPAEVVRECRNFRKCSPIFTPPAKSAANWMKPCAGFTRYYQEEGTHKLHAFAQWMPRLVYFARRRDHRLQNHRVSTPAISSRVNDMSHF